MFEGGVSQGVSPDLEACGERAFGILRSAAKALIAGMPTQGCPPALMIAPYLGAVARDRLAVRARRPGCRPLLMTPEELLEAGVLVYLQGLGIPDSRPAGSFAGPQRKPS